MTTALHAIHLSDTHLGPSRKFLARGANPADRLLHIAEAIQQLDFRPDFLIHTGDLANDPHPDAYRLASEILSPLEIPLYVVNGNHDDAGMLVAGLDLGPREPLGSGSDRLAYEFDLPGLRGFVLDAKVPEEEGPHGLLPESQLEALSESLDRCDRPFAIFLHFPPFPIHSAWMDKHLLLHNGERLHEVLRDKDLSRNRGVFFGHLHRGIQLYRDGILYSGVASPACRFSMGVEDQIVTFQGDCPADFHHLTFSETGTVVKTLSAGE